MIDSYNLVKRLNRMIEKMSKTQDCRGKPMYKIYLNHKTMLSYCLDAERMLREKKNKIQKN